MVFSLETVAMDTSENRNKEPSKETTNMKSTALVGLIVAGLLIRGAAANLFAQNAPCNGRGYGGPPKSEQKRAARQAAGAARPAM